MEEGVGGRGFMKESGVLGGSMFGATFFHASTKAWSAAGADSRSVEKGRALGRAAADRERRRAVAWRNMVGLDLIARSRKVRMTDLEASFLGKDIDNTLKVVYVILGRMVSCMENQQNNNLNHHGSNHDLERQGLDCARKIQVKPIIFDSSLATLGAIALSSGEDLELPSVRLQVKPILCKYANILFCLFPVLRRDEGTVVHTGCHNPLQLPPAARSIRCAICQAVTNVDDPRADPPPPPSHSSSHPPPPTPAGAPSPYSHAPPGPPPSAHGRKKAVIVGISYRFSPHELKGCLNDAKCMKHLLINKFQFPESSILMLTGN
ncbi:hypothetical protein RJ640_028784 [Escallonia rubra]|uniref:Uncharacterized protein n=1 Tax=Escallonia rubra TaxID=112253 RepID=A0AA88QGD3_9ASTE|nr:hypothetical protein RJ640_028784 [Escallonia rubra]